MFTDNGAGSRVITFMATAINPVEETEAILQLLATQLSSSAEEARALLY